MYYDLSIPWPARPAAGSSSSTAPPTKKQKGKQRETAPAAATSSSPLDGLSESERTELERTTRMAIKLGYQTIAYNVLLPLGNFDLQAVSDLNPCGRNAQPVFPDLDSRRSFKDGKSTSTSRTTLQLSRLTVTLDEHCLSGGKGNGMLFTSTNANILASYNLVAALPLDMPAFTHCCLNLSAPGPSSIDIITLDLASSPRLPFQLKRSMVLKAVADGVVFEICYGAAMRSASSSSSADKPVSKDARRNIIAGARELIRVTNGKGVIISSEARKCMEMRGPLDLCNFGTILGLKPDQAKNAVANSARLAVIRGHSSRQTYRGVLGNPEVSISVIQPATATGADKETGKAGEKRKRTEGD